MVTAEPGAPPEEVLSSLPGTWPNEEAFLLLKSPSSYPPCIEPLVLGAVHNLILLGLRWRHSAGGKFESYLGARGAMLWLRGSLQLREFWEVATATCIQVRFN